MLKAFKFRLYPNNDQTILLSKTFGCTRFIYNTMLSAKIKHYETTKQTLKTTPAQYKTAFPWLKEVDSLALANAQLNLEQAYKNFFKKPKNGFPKYKDKRHSPKKYTTNNQNGTIKLSECNKYIKLPKFTNIRIKAHRQLPKDSVIKSATIELRPTGKYYISILVDYEYKAPQVKVNKAKVLGLDYSSSHLYTDSQGISISYPKYYRQSEAKLAKAQRKLSLCKKGSQNYIKQKRKIALIHEKTANQRNDYLHKLSNELAIKWDAVIVEDINLQALSQCLKLGKSTMDNGFGMFRNMLSYKLTERGKQLVKIDKWYASSKLCNICGVKNSELTLKDREWDCAYCGTHHDRDYNAAVNIRDEGLRLINMRELIGILRALSVA